MLKLLHAFYGAVGNPPTIEGSLAAMAKALVSKASMDQISIALDRCMVECRGYPVMIGHIFDRIPGIDANVNAEKRLAWDVVVKFSSKWLRWTDEWASAYVEKGAPTLSPRILDSVRRSGGWSVYLGMTDKDFPFQQKRFFEEYEAWTEIQHIAADPSKLLEMPAFKQLVEAKRL